jgi:hypothetical protein
MNDTAARRRVSALAIAAAGASLVACFSSTPPQPGSETGAADASFVEDAPAIDATMDTAVAPALDGGDAALVDATVADASDAGADGAPEASPDAVADAAPDGESDASVDATVDAASDAAPDASVSTADASPDSAATPVLIGSGAGYGGFAIGPDAVYWLASANLYRASLDGGSPVVLVAGTAGRITVDANNVYWGSPAGSGYAIYYLPLDADAGTTPSVLTSSFELGAPTRLVVYGGYLYVAISGGGLDRFSTTPTGNPATNHPVMMAGSAFCPGAGGCGPDLAVTSNGAYWTVIAPADAGGGVYSCPLSAEAGVAWPGNLVAPSDNPVAVAADTTNVYWANAGPLDVNGTVLMTNQLDSGTVVTIASGQGIPDGIAIDTTTAPVTVYWSDRGSNNVAFAPATAGAVVTPIATGQSYPEDILLNATDVYWNDLNAGIYALPKP